MGTMPQPQNRSGAGSSSPCSATASSTGIGFPGLWLGLLLFLPTSVYRLETLYHHPALSVQLFGAQNAMPREMATGACSRGKPAVINSRWRHRKAKFSTCKIGAILLQSLKQTQGRVTMLQGGCPLPLPAPGRDPGAVDPAVSPHRSVQGASKSRQKSTPGVHFSRWNQFRWNQSAAAVFTVSTPNGAGIRAVARSPESITQNPISPRGRIRPQCPGHSRLGKVVSFQQSFQQRGTGLCTGRPGLCSPGAIWPDCIWPDS
ncbi:MAG: hypothetical protein KatS3mg050_3085 [Litorilinea sp.]|nr:MAG: hypothetical protein KatS3mg050_3085 [Litorilinea sp.]